MRFEQGTSGGQFHHFTGRGNQRLVRVNARLQKIAADLLQSAPANEAPLLAWPMACGSSVAGRTKALSFEDGVLTIGAADKAWCTQLHSFSDSYLQTLNRICPTKVSSLAST